MDAYTAEEVKQMEMKILYRLEWFLSSFTPLHFLGYYRSKGVLFKNDTMSGKPLGMFLKKPWITYLTPKLRVIYFSIFLITVEKLPRYVRKYCDFFADLSLQEYSFQKYRPSLLAAAIIVGSRQALHVKPIWRPELSLLTGVTQEEVMPIYDHLWKHYEITFPTAHAKHSQQAADNNSPKGISEV